jgi:hypothetical protein
MKTFSTFFIIAVFSVCISFCKKKQAEPQPEPPAPTPYSVRMTDAPAPYTAINIDLQAIEITGNGNTVNLNTTPGIYNLLNFTNGLDTLIATGNLTIDKVQQIRMILGPNNTIVTGGNTYTLTIPSGSESGLKLQVHQDLQAGVAYSVLLDFDANQSIVQEGNGSYQLKPVIRTVENAISGAISGKLSQPNVSAVITATSVGGGYSTVPNAAGEFIIKGLPAGTYSVSIVPVSPYNQVNLNNVMVTTGVTTALGIINI